MFPLPLTILSLLPTKSSYIELLQQMCLFSHATDLIGRCRDPEISKLNQKSTTIHEACPRCFKPIMHATTTPLRACKSCHQQIGLCFVCHSPVKGMFVWCSGCGHGGHLECALEWFGGSGGGCSMDVCPTGCGHRCECFVSDLMPISVCASVSFCDALVVSRR